MPRQMRRSERTAAWETSRPNDWPWARRLAREKGRATPTMNVNDGWIKSHSVQPRHSTWLVWWARIGQRPPARVFFT